MQITNFFLIFKKIEYCILKNGTLVLPFNNRFAKSYLIGSMFNRLISIWTQTFFTQSLFFTVLQHLSWMPRTKLVVWTCYKKLSILPRGVINVINWQFSTFVFCKYKLINQDTEATNLLSFVWTPLITNIWTFYNKLSLFTTIPLRNLSEN